MDNSHITPEQLAERWKVKVTTLKQWRWNGKGPIYSKVGNCIFYCPYDINVYEKSKRRRHTSDHPIQSDEDNQEQYQITAKTHRRFLSISKKKGTDPK